MARRRTSRSNTSRNKSKHDSSIRRWNTREDIPLDEVDEFHEQRDKILLEGDDAARDSDYDDDEVFALKGLAESSEEASDEEEVEDEQYDGEVEELELARKSKGKGKGKGKKKNEKKHAERSDEESGDEEGEEEEESWGLRKSAYYSSNAAQIESDDEEAREMEEKEALRLQAKLRASMREEDFGYAEALQNANAVDLKPIDDFWKPQEKPASTPPDTDKVSILRHLQKTNPEALALAFEWEDIARSVVKHEKKLAQIPDNKENKALSLIHLHHQTLLTYASLLAFYLHLRASEKYAARPELLRQHPILERLLTLKQSLMTFEALDFVMSDSEDESELDSEDEFDSEESELDLDGDDYDKAGMDLDVSDAWRAAQQLGLEPGELEELLAQVDGPISAPDKKKLPKVKLKVHPSKCEEERGQEQPPKKKQKTLNGSAVPHPKQQPKLKSKPKVAFDVEEPTLPGPTSSSSPSRTSHNSSSINNISFGFGEATTLDVADLADKKGRRKALRFHTAKIEGASARRKGAREALGGDDDVPYRERQKEKDRKKTEKATLGAGGEDLDLNGEEPGPKLDQGGSARSGKRGREEKSDGEGSASDEDEDDGYYSLVKSQKKAKQAEKKAQYEATKASTRLSPDTKPDTQSTTQRAPTRAILTNKGLTPKRSKSVRNPRVKKRQRFEKAKKKIASQKPVYKGGIGDPSRYGGETSGISKVVKSVRL